MMLLLLTLLWFSSLMGLCFNVYVSVSIQMEDFTYFIDLVSSMLLFFGSLFFH